MEEKRLRFGLTPMGLIINGIAMTLIHSIFCAIRVYQKVSFEQLSSMTDSQKDDLVEWYIYYPTLYLSIVLIGDYFDYKYPNEKFLSLKKFSLTLLVFLPIIFIAKPLFLTILYSLFK